MRGPRKPLAFLLLAALLAAVPGLTAEDRPGTIDAVILVDKSLSMEGQMAEVRKFAAEEIVGAILVPGDRLVIEAFYGKIERLFAGTIRSDADKAEAIRRLNGLVGDGPFTDIGAALDRAAADLAELGSPERPKYVVLLSDERQEAPSGSPYVARDYKLVHPALTYVKRTDHGAWREIVVGIDVAAKVDQAFASLYQTLATAPERREADYPPLPEETPAGLEGAGALAPEVARAGATPGGSGAAGAGAGSAGTTSSALLGLPLPLLLALLALAGGGVAALLLLSRRKRAEERHDA